MSFDSNDPRLTAYALGECSEADRTAIEQALQESPEARAALDEIRATADFLRAGLAGEADLRLSDAQHAELQQAAANPAKAGPPRRLPWYARYSTIGLAAAATILIGVTIQFLQSSTRFKRAEVSLPGSIPNLKTNTELTRPRDAGGGAGAPTLGQPRVDAALQPPAQQTRDKKVAAEEWLANTPTEGQREKLVRGTMGMELTLRSDGADPTYRQPGLDSDKQLGTTAAAPPPPATVAPAQTLTKGEAAGRRVLTQSGQAAPAQAFPPSTGGASYSFLHSARKEDVDQARKLIEDLDSRADPNPFDKLDDTANFEVPVPDGAFGGGKLPSPMARGEFRLLQPQGGFNTESYARVEDNPFLAVTQQPLSTFSIDVDTASYSNVRRFLMEGQRPPPDAVRIEELINYFPYDYPPPIGDVPFSVNIESAECPWRPDHRLVRIGLKGYVPPPQAVQPTNLVFLIDVSGSMDHPKKLPLLKQAMQMLVQQLGENDRVAIVVYAGASGLVLPPTNGSQRDVIAGSIDRLQAGGSTNGGAGIELAYRMARENFIRGGVNRVILATDGDFNVGVTNEGDLTRLIEEQAKSGVFLTVLGFGMGNYKDSMLEKLADKGNGNYAYIDTYNEARKVFVEQLRGTLMTIAKDVKIQIEFNPARVSNYRLIGYENRVLAAQEFNDDRKDAGEIGAGHTVTALYEIAPAGQPVALPSVDPLKYQTPPASSLVATSAEMMTVKLRYKQPDGDVSRLIETPFIDAGRTFASASPDFKFAAAVAAFGMQLRESPYRGNWSFGAVVEVAQEGRGADPSGYRSEFVDLVRRASTLMPGR